MKPKVSIIVSVFKVEKYLKRCIESLINQTLREIEIILVDDGSPDNSPKICDNYKEKDDRVKVIHKSNGGVSAARNRGLDIAEGDFVLFIDSDDWCENIMIEEMYNRANKDESDIVACSYTIDYVNNNFSVKKEIGTEANYTNNIDEAIYILDSNGMFNVVWNKLYRKKILIDNNILFDISCTTGEDLLFNCVVYTKIKKASFINEKLYHYMREDDDTLVTKYRSNLFDKIKQFNNARNELYKNYNMTDERYVNVYINKYCENIFLCIPNLYRKNTNLKWNDKIEFYKQIFKDQKTNKYIQHYNEKGFHYSVFRQVYRLNNPIVANIFYTILFNFRHQFESSYKIFRKHIVNKQEQ